MSVLELSDQLAGDSLAESLVQRWDTLKNQRSAWEAEKEELRNYIFATDTSKTSNNALPWKNSTTLPKLCQIRDNLHANYISALFPNDNWLRWEGHSQDSEVLDKREAIQAYMENKTREDNFRSRVSQFVYDYIDYGVCFSDVVWVNERKLDPETEEEIPGYVGPRAVRISPLDIVFDITSPSFQDSYKIVRSIKHIGTLQLEYDQTRQEWLKTLLERSDEVRKTLGRYTKDDFKKASALSVDGFGDYYEYLKSGFVEILEFTGSIHDPDTGELLNDHIITVIDRTRIVRNEPIPAWKRGGFKVFTSWRKRPDNLMGMGPLDNLVGMQYRIDHIQNATADARDLTVMPPMKVKGELLEDVEWGPFARFQLAEDGDMAPLFTGSMTNEMTQELVMLLQLMEEMAGAPKEAMGIRSPGEKTAFEVQTLASAAGRIFQEKVSQFEIEFLEPLLNNMLQCAVKNMQGSDLLRVMDTDVGVAHFMSITKEDITAKGKLRPVGARHFAQQAQIMQNLVGLANSAIWPKIEPHFGDVDMARLVEDLLQLRRFDLFATNAGVYDKLETQRAMNTAEDQLAAEALTPV